MKKKDRNILWALLVVLAVTGLGYWYFKKIYTSADPFAIVSHPLQSWLMKGHLLIAPVFVFLMGWISFSHIWPRYKSGKSSGRRTGILNGVTLALCCLSGYYLQLIISSEITNVMAWAHTISGIIALILLGLHQRSV